jgi:hypothetical protein
MLRRALLLRFRHDSRTRHPERSFLESRLGNGWFSQHTVEASSRSSAPHLIDTSEAPMDYDHSAVVYEDMISEEEHDSLVSDFGAKLKRYVASPDSPRTLFVGSLLI